MMFKPPPLADDESNDPVCLADWVELNLLAGTFRPFRCSMSSTN